MKVFGIGLSKTGTHSLDSALGLLGFKSKHWPTSWSDFNEYDALSDIQCAVGYKFMDAMLPGSKFILTVRDKARWLDSCRHHFRNGTGAGELEQHKKKLRMAMYGCDRFDEFLFSQAYDRHVSDVIEWFSIRGDLLVLDVSGNDAWSALCGFLGKPIPSVPFPHENKTFK